MIPQILHQTAASSFLTWEERVLLARFEKLLPHWKYTLWTDEDILTVFQRNFASYVDMFLQIKRGVVIADLGRYAILYEQGGIYLDTDYKLLKAPLQYLEASCILPVEEGVAPNINSATATPDFKLGNAILGSAPRFDFWKDFLIDIFTSTTIEEFNSGNPVLTTGPVALTRFWQRHQEKYDGIRLPAKNEFYPALTGFNLSFAGTAETQGVHLCWGSWRGKRSIQKYKNFMRRKLSCLT